MIKQVRGAKSPIWKLRHLLAIAAVLLVAAFFMAPVAAADFDIMSPIDTPVENDNNAGIALLAEGEATPAAITPTYDWYGDGSTETFTISSVADFAGFAKLTQGNVVIDETTTLTKTNFTGKTVTLGADITFANDQYWISDAGNYQIKGFAGTFDGNGKTIYNLKLTGSGNYICLFNNIQSGGTIKDLTLDGVTVDGSISWSGGIVGLVNNGATVTGCTVIDLTVTGDSITNFGGIASYVYGGATVTDCDVNNMQVTVSTTGQSIGGIAGQFLANAIVSGCDVNGLTVTNTGNVIAKWVGGVAGTTGASMTNCNAKNVMITLYETVATGGLIGQITAAATIENCDVDGFTVSATNNQGNTLHQVGGLIGTVNAATTIESCTVNDVNLKSGGDVNIVGGMIGVSVGDISVESSAVTNVEIYGENNYGRDKVAGGLLGLSRALVTVKDTDVSGVHFGTKEGTTYDTGGLIGQMEGNNIQKVTIYTDCEIAKPTGHVTHDIVSFDSKNYYMDFSGETIIFKPTVACTTTADGKEIGFATVQEAIDEAQDAGTVTLLQDVTENTALSVSKPLTMNWNSKSIPATITLSEAVNSITLVSGGATTDVTLVAPAVQEGYNVVWYKGDDTTTPVSVENLGKQTAATKYSYAYKPNYTIKFNANIDGVEGTMDDLSMLGGIAAELTGNAYSVTGYTFSGWNTKANGMGTAYADKESVVDLTDIANGEVLLYAQWKIDQYTITLQDTDGTTIKEITQDYGTAVIAPADPEKAGYTFDGWDPTIPATMPAEDLTITAQWTINQYTITFETDGGTTIAPITQDFGTAVTAPAEPTKENYVFNEWDKAVPATMPAENIVITAQWKPEEHTLTFMMDETTSYTTITKGFGELVTAPAYPTKAGYTFDGWTVNGAEAEVPATMPAQDMTFVATWKVNSYPGFVYTLKSADSISIYETAKLSIPINFENTYDNTGETKTYPDEWELIVTVTGENGVIDSGLEYSLEVAPGYAKHVGGGTSFDDNDAPNRFPVTGDTSRPAVGTIGDFFTLGISKLPVGTYTVKIDITSYVVVEGVRVAGESLTPLNVAVSVLELSDMESNIYSDSEKPWNFETPVWATITIGNKKGETSYDTGVSDTLVMRGDSPLSLTKSSKTLEILKVVGDEGQPTAVASADTKLTVSNGNVIMNVGTGDEGADIFIIKFTGYKVGDVANTIDKPERVDVVDVGYVLKQIIKPTTNVIADGYAVYGNVDNSLGLTVLDAGLIYKKDVNRLTATDLESILLDRL